MRSALAQIHVVDVDDVAADRLKIFLSRILENKNKGFS